MNKTVKKILPKVLGLKLNSLFFVRPEAAISQAFYLFCGPRRGKINPEQKKFLDPAKNGKINLGKQIIQSYHWKGNKETILLLHGWESNTQRWQQLIEKLQQENYNIIAFDAPAHGDSSGKLFNVPLYSKCVTVFVEKHRPDYIIGHSIGAMTTIYEQRLSPISAKKIVLLGAPSELMFIMKDFQKTLNLSSRFMKGFEAYFNKKFGFSFKEFSTAKFAEKIKQPGLLIHDTYDKIVPVSASKAIHKNWNNSKLIITEGAGHSLNNDAIHAEIISFLKK